MSDRRSTTRAEITTFLAITLGASAVFHYLIISGGGLRQTGGLVPKLMWMPALGAIVTQLVFHRSLRGLGWRLPAPRWAALGYLLPVAYATAAYGLVYLLGLGRMDLSRFSQNPAAFVLLYPLLSLLTATGEEIGWRGFLVPAFARIMPLPRVAVVTGLIWAAWHMPLLIFADYNAGTPTWYGVTCFTVLVIGISFALAWLRMRSGSFWPAAILHAVHNLYIQGFFDVVTVDTGRTRWFTTEFGAALALMAVVVGLVVWRRMRTPA